MEWINILVTPVVAAIVGIGVWFVQSRIEEIRRAQERLHDDRRRIYADILEPYIRIFSGASNEAHVRKAMQQIVSYDYKKTAFELSLLGSDQVVRSFNEMMQYVYQAEGDEKKMDPYEMLKRWGAFLLEIRRSVGDPKTRLESKDMLRGLVKGVDAVFERGQRVSP